MPGLADGKADELLEKVQTIRELAESFNKKSATVMEEGRRSLLDVSEAAVKMTRKIDPQAVSGERPASAEEAEPETAVAVPAGTGLAPRAELPFHQGCGRCSLIKSANLP